jgi:hypothetical protein
LKSLTHQPKKIIEAGKIDDPEKIQIENSGDAPDYYVWDHF